MVSKHNKLRKDNHVITTIPVQMLPYKPQITRSQKGIREKTHASKKHPPSHKMSGKLPKCHTKNMLPQMKKVWISLFHAGIAARVARWALISSHGSSRRPVSTSISARRIQGLPFHTQPMTKKKITTGMAR